jgi:hypothetical protein
MSTTANEEKQSPRWRAGDAPKVLERGRTVCNERNEKGKLCNGHLKQIRPVNEPAAEHLRGDDVLYKCQFCGALYMGPPLGHVRAPAQKRFVQKELIDILRAAGGTLPFFDKSRRWREPPPVDSSPSADLHRPAAEAQAATGHASAVPLSPAAASASPVAGAETPEELAPDATTPATTPTPTVEGLKP